MKYAPRLLPLLGLLLFASAEPANAQRGQRRSKPTGDIGLRTEPESAGIAWFGTLDGALAEAKRTDRPILLMSAAPSCREVPGVW